jgi:ubiquinone/menaquinone biosynthesis C-methylase UbiE
MFTKSAQYYDVIYTSKDYRAEAERIIDIIRENIQSQGDRLLVVACGTGRHIQFLKNNFHVEGLDCSSELLDVARRRNPAVTFHHADMKDFKLRHSFDVVTCLFSSIGYVRRLEHLTRAVACMTEHLSPGGVLIIEPWLTPKTWEPGTVHAVFVDEPELKIARINTSDRVDRLSVLDFHYLIGTSEGVEHFVERHELGLFEIEEMRSALTTAGLVVSYDEHGLTGRGLHIGLRPI